MQMIDFEYNGERLSDYGLMVCRFDEPDETIEIGSNVALNKVKAPNAYRYMSVSYDYDENPERVIQICKSICNTDDEAMTEEELRKYVRWLNRKGYYKFKPIYDDNTFTDVYYNATFNVKLINIEGKIVGLELTIDTDAPFGYVDPVKYHFTFNSTSDRLIIQDYSDEVGYIYCDATIKCLEGGDLAIYNIDDNINDVIVNNCSAGEVITLRGQQKIIESDSWHEALYNDFNYNFLRICNSYENTNNEFWASIKCEVTITYSPIRKVGLIV